MAKSESQGLQIAVIIFAFLTIALSITTFYFFNELSKVKQTQDAAVADATKFRNAASTALTESNEVKALIGVPPETPLADLKQTFADDMAKYGATLAQDKKFYRDALVQQQVDILAAKQEVLVEKSANASYKTRIDGVEAANQQRVAQVQGGFEVKANDFTTTAQGFTEKERALVTQKDELVRQITEKQAELDELNRSAADAKQALQKDIEKLERGISILRVERDELTNESPEVPDGQIRWVNQRNRSVWLNLGSADRLTPLVKFSVFGSDGSAVARTATKGSVEVTKILGEHLAEARILEDDINNPLLPGDLIYTPLWRAGRQEHFAFAGVLDIDGDDNDDSDVVRDLVRMNNAVVDAWLDHNGKLEGGLTVQTRYLVVGDAPKNQADEYSKLRAEAVKKGIPLLPLDKFLDYVGYASTSRFVQYGNRANPNQFMDNERDKRYSNPPPATDKFRQRRPPMPAGANKGGSAY